MSGMKQFTFAAKKAADPVTWIKFEINDVKCRALAMPGDGQVAYMMGKTAPGVPQTEQVQAILNFFDSVLDDATQSYILGRMLNPKDAFGFEEVTEILGYLMEVWSGDRPTLPSDDSTESPDTTGPNSPPPTPEWTSYDSE